MRTIGLIISLLFIIQLEAQEFKGGLELGLNACQIDGDQLGGYHHPALQFGGFVNLMLKKNYFVELGLKYSGKGATQSLQTVQPGYMRTKISLRYIELPLMLGKTVWNKYNLRVGLLPNYLFDTRAIDAFGNVVDERLYDYYAFDIPASFSVEYIWSEHWRSNMQFSQSIWFISDNPFLRNRYITISVKYIFMSNVQ